MSNWTIQGKVCLITGGTAGIGKATALELARQGAEVIIVGRSVAKTQDTVNDIRATTGSSMVSAMVADLSSQRDIRRLAKEFKAAHPQLHVLINNAGGFYMDRQTTVDGIEMTFALNHLAYFLLTELLLDVLKASAPSRIINVSSQAQAGGKLNFNDLQGEKRYVGFNAYSQSKLANVAFTVELARRLEGTGVSVNALHPGLVNSNFGKNNNNIAFKLFGLLGRFIGISPERGAQTSVYLATSPDVDGVTGKYFNNKKQAVPSSIATDPVVGKLLWEISEVLVSTSA